MWKTTAESFLNVHSIDWPLTRKLQVFKLFVDALDAPCSIMICILSGFFVARLGGGGGRNEPLMAWWEECRFKTILFAICSSTFSKLYINICNGM
jgi:hypothetical protein